MSGPAGSRRSSVQFRRGFLGCGIDPCLRSAGIRTPTSSPLATSRPMRRNQLAFGLRRPRLTLASSRRDRRWRSRTRCRTARRPRRVIANRVCTTRAMPTSRDWLRGRCSVAVVAVAHHWGGLARVMGEQHRRAGGTTRFRGHSRPSDTASRRIVVDVVPGRRPEAGRSTNRRRCCISQDACSMQLVYVRLADHGAVAIDTGVRQRQTIRRLG